MNFNIYNNIDLNLYKIFLIVAETGNISSAAKTLFVSQPAISYSIKELERNLKVKLFIRGPKGVTLTEEGKRLLYYVKTAFNNIYSGEKIINDTVNMEFGEIRIGVPSHIGSAILTDCITEFNKSYPNIKFVIINSSSAEMMKMLGSKELNIVIDSFPIADNEYSIDTYNLFELSNCLIANKKFEYILNEAPISIETLNKIPLILPIENSATRVAFEQQFNYTNSSFKPIIEVYSSELLIDLVKNGIGVGYCPKALASKLIKNGELIEIFTDTQLPTTQVCLVYSSNYLTHASSEFINILKKSSNFEINTRSINIINSKSNKIIDSQDISFLYEIFIKEFNIKDINLNYENFNNDEIVDLLEKLYIIGANISLTLKAENINKNFKEICKYCKTIILHDNFENIKIIDKNIFCNNVNLKECIPLNNEINFLLSIDIKKNKEITTNKIKKLILTSKKYNINLQFNEPFIDSYNSKYTIRYVEIISKKMGYIQTGQKVNKRVFSLSGHFITIFRHFCAVTSSKFKPDQYCNRYNSINIGLDGTIQNCTLKNEKINLYNEIKIRNSNKIKYLINEALEKMGKHCKYCDK